MSPKTIYEPMFSLISVCLNNLEGLKRTYQSLKVQTCNDFEWIVVDGASMDGTPQYIQALQEEYCRFISEPDDGLYDAMNKGIELAKGNYLLFLNAGDELASFSTLADISAFAKDNDLPDLIYGDALERTSNGNLICKPAYSWRKVWYGMFTHHQAMFYRRQIIAEQRYHLEYTIASDYAFTCELLCKTRHVAYLQKPICLFEGGGLTASGTVHLVGIKEQWIIGEKILGRSIFQRIIVVLAQVGKHTIKRIVPFLYNKVRYQ